MWLFGKKKNLETPANKGKEEDKKVEVNKVEAKRLVSSGRERLGASEIIRPRITEKASLLGDSHTYVFEISDRATKRSVSLAVEEIYRVKPVDVRILPIKRKSLFLKGKRGFSRGGRKAYVELRAEDKIEII